MFHHYKVNPKLGMGFVIVFLCLMMLLALVGEIKPVLASELQGGSAPVAVDDFFGFQKGVVYNAHVPGVLANDSDPEGEVISVIPESGPTTGGGTYSLDANGFFTYTPPNNTLASDSFTYQIVDTVLPQNPSNIATVTLVGSDYDIQNDRYGFRTGIFHYAYLEIGVLSNDRTIPLPTGAVAELFGSGPSHGSLVPTGCLPPAGDCPTSGLLANGSFTYYPDASGALTDQFQYIVKNNAGVQIGGPATVFLTNSVTCSIDVDGPNDEPGQGDLTQFCRDTYYETMPEDELAMSVNWDEVNLGGTNSADACALFDTDGDRGVNYALCMSWQNNGAPTPGYPRFYGCNDRLDFPKNCTGYYEITQTSPRFSCRLVDTHDDPFGVGAEYPYDNKAICYIPYAGNFPEQDPPVRVTLLDVCAYPSRIPNSDYKDCVLGKGIPTLKVIKDVVGVETYRSTEWEIGISPLPIRPLDTSTTPNAPADNNLFGDDETPSYALEVGGNYTITETEGALTPYPFLELDTQEYLCRNYGGETVLYYPTNGLFTLGSTITLPTIALNDRWECTFRNTYAPATAVELYNFRASVQLNEILLEWETVSEYNNLGFNIFRATGSQAADIVKLNDTLIYSVDPGGMAGGEYSYIDNFNLQPYTTYYYWLQDVDLDGTLTMHGPIFARIGSLPGNAGYKIFLPGIIR